MYQKTRQTRIDMKTVAHLRKSGRGWADIADILRYEVAQVRDLARIAREPAGGQISIDDYIAKWMP